MMFILRGGGKVPSASSASAILVKAARKTPATVPGGEAKTDYFCVGTAEAMAVLGDEGWEVVELRDGWYAGDNGGGVAIFGHGKYWEIRDTLFTVREAAGPAASAASGDAAADLVNVRRAIFGV
jgi:hypothetical protein